MTHLRFLSYLDQILKFSVLHFKRIQVRVLSYGMDPALAPGVMQWTETAKVENERKAEA